MTIDFIAFRFRKPFYRSAYFFLGRGSEQVGWVWQSYWKTDRALTTIEIINFQVLTRLTALYGLFSLEKHLATCYMGKFHSFVLFFFSLFCLGKIMSAWSAVRGGAGYHMHLMPGSWFGFFTQVNQAFHPWISRWIGAILVWERWSSDLFIGWPPQAIE